MAPGDEFEHPYTRVDLAQMDVDFPVLLAHAAALEREGREAGAAQGLSPREARLFRFGLLMGLGEWDLACGAVDALLEDGFLYGPEVELAAAESVHVKGLPACVHLAPALAAHGLHAPGSVAEAVAPAGRAGSAAAERGPSGRDGLTERELFALGLGITWGARCWDT